MYEHARSGLDLGKLQVVAKKEPASATSLCGWAFLTNHARVLALLSINPGMTLRRIALAVDITERATQRIVKDLVDAGIVERERIGRRSNYHLQLGSKLAHPDFEHLTVGDLVSFLRPC